MADLGATVPSPRPRDIGIRLEEVESQARPALVAAMDEDAHVIPGRLARGCRCFGAWVEEDLAAFCWLTTNREWIGEVERPISLPLGDCYIWNCVTLAPHRRRGLFRELVSHTAEIARRDGFARLWIGSVGEARPLYPSLLALGFSPVADVNLFGAPGLALVHLTPVARADPTLVFSACSALALRRWALQSRRSLTH